MRFSCPSCGAIYDIKNERRLAESGGRVECFRCQKIFTIGAAAKSLSNGEPGSTDSRNTRPEPKPQTEAKPPDEVKKPQAPTPPRRSKPIPPLLEDTAARSPDSMAGLLWGAGALFLVTALSAQALWYLRANPEVHHILTRICEPADCEIPPLRDLKAISLIDRVFTRDPEYPDLLVLRLRFANNATYAQPYPGVELTLLDNTQSEVGKSRVTAEEYSGLTAVEALGPGEFGEIELGMLDPGRVATGFSIDFF